MFELLKECCMRAIAIDTAQNVRLEYEIASVGERILAALLDYFIFIGWFTLSSIVMSMLEVNFGLLTGVIMVLPVVFYHLVCEIFFNGQSIGKRTLNIRVLKKDGTQPSLGDYLMRWVFRIVDCTIGSGSVAVICILINGKGQRLGDIAAGTTVVRTRRSTRLEDIRIRETPPGYQVTYPEVLTLTDRDISTIKRILRKSVHTGKLEMLQPLAERVSGLMGIESDREPYAFLTIILNDYYYLADSASTEIS